MSKWKVGGAVHASTYLGEFEASTGAEAIEKAYSDAHISVCHQCGQDPEPANLWAENEETGEVYNEPTSEDDWKRRALEAEAKLEERESDMHMRIRLGYDKTVADLWRAKLDACEAETIARVVTALNALSDQYFEGDMVEQCDFTAEGIAIAADWIREGKWKEKEG